MTSDKDGPNSVLERELPDAEIVISQPFWPAYMTAERLVKAPKLKLDDNTLARAQLNPVVSVGGARRLEHRRLRQALV